MSGLRGRNYRRWRIYADDDYGKKEWPKLLFMMEEHELCYPSPIVRLGLIIFPSREDARDFLALGTIEDSVARALRNYFDFIDRESYVAPSTDARQLESDAKPKIFVRLPSR
jgi:hypothetical protein